MVKKGIVTLTVATVLLLTTHAVSASAAENSPDVLS